MNECEKFFKKYELSNSEKAAHDTAVEIQKKKIRKLEAEINIAAAAGELETFRKIKEEKAAEEDALLVMEASFKLPAPDREEAVNAWISYRAKYANDFRKKYEALKAARSAVKDALDALAECQNQALTIRERLADICGIDYRNPANGHALDIFPVERINEDYVDHPRFALRMPDAAYLTELGFFAHGGDSWNPFPEVEKYNQVFRLDRACK